MDDTHPTRGPTDHLRVSQMLHRPASHHRPAHWQDATALRHQTTTSGLQKTTGQSTGHLHSTQRTTFNPGCRRLQLDFYRLIKKRTKWIQTQWLLHTVKSRKWKKNIKTAKSKKITSRIQFYLFQHYYFCIHILEHLTQLFTIYCSIQAYLQYFYTRMYCTINITLILASLINKLL